MAAESISVGLPCGNGTHGATNKDGRHLKLSQSQSSSPNTKLNALKARLPGKKLHATSVSMHIQNHNTTSGRAMIIPRSSQ